MSAQAKHVESLRKAWRSNVRAFGADSVHAANALRELQRQAAHLISGAYCVQRWDV